MTILVNRETRILVQGITGREGTAHTASMIRYGTGVVAGVTPGKGGATVEGVPVYDDVEEAVAAHPDINTSIIFVPAPYAADAVYEAIDSGIKLLVVITEHVPVHDATKLLEYANARGVKVIGPNTPGVISPGESKVGIMPGHLFSRGDIGIISRSGTLTYEIAAALSNAGLGQSTAVGLGGDPVTGLNFIEVLKMFEEDPSTKGVVAIGEIGGDAEERLASFVREAKVRKPMVAFVAGQSAPPGKRMGHAGAIITMGSGTASAKRTAFREAGISVADIPSQIPAAMAEALKRAAAGP